MTIKNVEHLDDRVRIHYHFNQPDGWLDDDTLDIPHDSVSKLPLLPEGKSGEELLIPKCNQTIVLVPYSIREPETFSGCRSWHYEIYLK